MKPHQPALCGLFLAVGIAVAAQADPWAGAWKLNVIGATRVVNAGSVGSPFGEPGADWLLLGPDVDFRHTNYNLEEAAERIRATGMPWPEDFAARYVLEPPSAAQMLDVFTRTSFWS